MLKGVLKQRKSQTQRPGREKGKVSEGPYSGTQWASQTTVHGGCLARAVGQGGNEKEGFEAGEEVPEGLGMLG